MAQYMALNGGALPHPALLAHGALPLPPHPAAPWTQPMQQSHGPPDLPFKANPHPEAIARYDFSLIFVMLQLYYKYIYIYICSHAYSYYLYLSILIDLCIYSVIYTVK